MSKVFEKIKEILVDDLGYEEEEIRLETNLIKDLEVDSLDMLELSMSIEEEFGIGLGDEDLEKLDTIKSIIEYVEGK